MAVPRMSQLCPGVGVNVVLKNDQRSGMQTGGRISEILTRGDHPRGIKVCLMDGKIGRVQSLSSDSDPTGTAEMTFSAPIRYDTLSDAPKALAQQSLRAGRGARNEKVPLQQDLREDSIPVRSQSLANYIEVPTSSKPASAPQNSVQADSVQNGLEKDFPKLDTALIAAILADHEDVDAARSVLASLS